jgi:hypothetical protein
MCFTHLKLTTILQTPLFSTLFEYLLYSGELDKFASTDNTFMLNPIRYMQILEMMEQECYRHTAEFEELQ